MAALFFAEMRFDPQRPAASATAIGSCCRRGTRRRFSTRRGPRPGSFPRERAAEAARARLRSRRPSDAAAAVRRRRHRIARPGPLRRRRHRAQRAPHRLRLPHLRADGRRRDGRRLGVGSGATSAHFDKLDNLCGITDVNGLGQSRADAAGSTTWSSSRAAGARSAGTRSSIDGHDMDADPRRAGRGARDQGPADDDPGADVQGQGRVVRRGQGRLARQGVQEGRGAGPRRSPSSRRSSCRAPSRRRARVADPDRRRGPPRRSRADAGRRRPTSWATRSPRARPTAPRSPSSATPTRASSRSTPTSRTRRSASSSRSAHPDRFYRELHRRAGDGRRGDGPGRARRDSVPVHVRLLPDARRRLHPHGGDQQRQHQAGRLARRRVDRRGRPVADGARRPGDDARRSRTSRCSIRATRSAPSGSWRVAAISRARSTCARRGRRRR